MNRVLKMILLKSLKTLSLFSAYKFYEHHHINTLKRTKVYPNCVFWWPSLKKENFERRCFRIPTLDFHEIKSVIFVENLSFQTYWFRFGICGEIRWKLTFFGNFRFTYVYVANGGVSNFRYLRLTSGFRKDVENHWCKSATSASPYFKDSCIPQIWKFKLK